MHIHDLNTYQELHPTTTASSNSIGVIVEENTQLHIVSCTLHNCTTNSAIYVDRGSIVVDCCDISSNEIGIALVGNVNCEVICSTITNNNIGISCETESEANTCRFIVQRSNISDNLTYGIFANHNIRHMSIFDNYMRENHLSAIRIGEFIHSQYPHESMIDNIIHCKDNTPKEADLRLLTYFTGEKTYHFDQLDMNIIVNILSFTLFPFGQCLKMLNDLWVHGSVREYEDYESLVIQNLYGFKKQMRHVKSRPISLLYQTLDVSFTDKNIDLFVCFQNGVIPTVGVTCLSVNEGWIDQNGLKIVNRLKNSLVSLTVDTSSNLSSDDVKRLNEWLQHHSKNGRPVHLAITGPMITTNFLNEIQTLRTLKLRSLDDTSITSDNKRDLTSFMIQGGKSLSTVELSYYPIGTESVSSVLTSVQNCRNLTINGADLECCVIDTDQMNEQEEQQQTADVMHGHVSSPLLLSSLQSLLSRNSVLTSINLNDNYYLGDEAVEILAKSTSLKHLSLDDCGLTSRALIAILRDSTSIQKLSMAANDLDDKALDRMLLERNTTLREIDLSGNLSLTESGFGNLMFNRTIDTLIINGCPGSVSDATVQQLSCMSNLTCLHVSGNDLTYSALLCLKHSNITELDVSYNHITDEGAVIIVQHPSIRKLNMASNQVTWIGARELFQSKMLEELDLSNNVNVDDSTSSTFSYLEKNGALRHLELANIRAICRRETLDVLLNRNECLEYINLRGTQLGADLSQSYINRSKLDYKLNNLKYLGLLDDDDDDSEALAFFHHQNAPDQIHAYLE